MKKTSAFRQQTTQSSGKPRPDHPSAQKSSKTDSKMTGRTRAAIRTKHSHRTPLAHMLASHAVSSISRQQALQRALNFLALDWKHPQALQLIELFNLQAEELSEAGVSYEALKSLEQRCITLRSAIL